MRIFLKLIIVFAVFLFITNSVSASWNLFLPLFEKQEFSVKIGDRFWYEDEAEVEENLDVSEIDEIVASIIASDPLLQDGITRLHILGYNNGSNVPNQPDSIASFDTLIWVRESGTVMVALATAPLNVSIFGSWENLEEGLNNSNVPVTSWGNMFRLGDVYTRTHAPVLYNGQMWFERHDNVVSSPIIGDDWFLINDDWVSQSYPIGSIVMHQGRHFHKISEVDAKPGTDVDVWREIPSYEEMSNVMTWYHTYWDSYYIVSFEGEFYISLVDNNSQVPGTGDGWALIPRFGSIDIVQQFVMGRHYEIGDVVRVGDGRNALYFLKRVGWASPNPIGDNTGAWLLVQNWHELMQVKNWRADVLYGNDFVGLVVESNGRFFEKLPGWADLGTPPDQQPMVWRRILSWNESIAPLSHEGPGVYAENSVFRFIVNDNEYFFASIQNVPSWFQGSVQTPSEFFRPIEEWNSKQIYTVFGHGIWDEEFGRRYHTYTFDDDGNRIFWVLRGSSAGASGTVIGEHPEESPFWERIEFFNRESSFVMHVDGVPLIWNRNPNIPLDNYIRQPSVLHDDWIRREKIISDEFVYTIYGDGMFGLWRRNGTGLSAQEPGIGSEWIFEDFKTGFEFVYTVNAAGIITFWRSPTQSATMPGGSEWIRYSPPISKESDVVYFEVDGQPFYYSTDRGDSLFHLSTAWVGGSNKIQYYWDANNEYQVGDVVVFGETRVNTYRYFRLRPGFSPENTRGISPMSPLGRQMWQPLRLIDWD